MFRVQFSGLLVSGFWLRVECSGADMGDGGGERGLAVVDVPDRPDVQVRLV